MYERFVEAGNVNPDETEVLITCLVRIYELSWRLEDFTAANSCIDRIIAAIQKDVKAPYVEHVAQVFGPLSLHSSPLRDLLEDFQIQGLWRSWTTLTGTMMNMMTVFPCS